MIVLIGTHALAQTTLQMPDPAWNDDKNRDIKVKWHQMLSGKLYSYVSGSRQQTLKFDFLLDEGKAEELVRFFKVYAITINRLYDHKGVAWTFQFLKKDLALTTQFRSEMKQVTLELLATRLP